MSQGTLIKFLDCCSDHTRKGTKIKQEDYLKEGQSPVIDQGKSLISGYTEESKDLFTDLPVVIFGDHTRILKYIDFPFYLGADGTKIIKAKSEDLNTKYLYYALKKVHIPNMGYSRHFKFLKESEILIPSLETQEYMVKTLDLAMDVIDKYREKTTILKELLLSVFYEMFGDAFLNDKNWNTDSLKNVCSFFNGKAHEKNIVETGAYVVVNSKFIASEGNTKKHSNQQLFPLLKDDIAMVMSDVPNGKALAKCYLIEADDVYSLNQRICCIKSDQFIPIFLFYLLNRHQHFLSYNDGNSQTNLRKDDILSCQLILPPLSLQKQFAQIVAKIQEEQLLVEEGLHEAEQLFGGLMQEYFQ